MSVDLVAERYLKNYMQMRLPESPALTSPVERVVSSLDDTFNHETVILARAEEPRFFAGQLNSGRIVWEYNALKAKRVSREFVQGYESKLGCELFAMWPYV